MSFSMNIRPEKTERKIKCSDGVVLASQLWEKPESAGMGRNGGGGPGGSSSQMMMMMMGGGPPMSISSNNGAMNGRSSSGGSGEKKRKVLLLHGWLDNCRSFHYLAPALTQALPDGSEVLALDMPGHGLSAHKSTDGPPIVLSAAAFYVSQTIKEMGWSKDPKSVTLIGHSMGAQVACVYAAAFPEHIDRLVLLEGIGPTPRPDRDVAKHIRQHITRRNLELDDPMKPPVYLNMDKAVEARIKSPQRLPGKQYISEEAAREIVSRSIKKTHDGKISFIHDMRLQWPEIQYFTPLQTEALYRDIHVPTAVFGAEDGYPTDQENIDKMAELLKPKVSKVLPGSHHFHADPDTQFAVCQAVIKFITDKK